MIPELEPRAPYRAPPDAEPPRPCIDCGADVYREHHLATCPQPGEIRRMAWDAKGRRLEDLLADATRRAWTAWTRAGGSFPARRAA